jgi:Zn-dependent protease with chaperone function
MHSLMIILAATVAIGLRCCRLPSGGNWAQRWQNALIFFLLPILLVGMTLVAIVCMGPQGSMVGMPTVGVTYHLALLLLIVALGAVVKVAIATWQTLCHLRRYPCLDRFAAIAQTARLLEHPHVFCAQIGFWQPELIVSQGLLDLLSPEHLNAVLAHEQAHYYYRDTFWFFILGVLRRLTFWLPQTEGLWEELLTLRELRADRWATQYTDALLLAEALFLAVSTPVMPDLAACAPLHPPHRGDRLQERIEALLSQPTVPQRDRAWTWVWLSLTLLPLLALPFHT